MEFLIKSDEESEIPEDHSTSLIELREAKLSTIVLPSVEFVETPLRDALKADGQAFNDHQVDELRNGWTYERCLEEYLAAHEQVRGLVSDLPAGLLQRTGAIPWYGAQYDLEDLIAYQYYGHKREHSGQVQTFRDRFR